MARNDDPPQDDLPASNDPAGWRRLAIQLFRQSRFEEALVALDRGLELAPNEPKLWLGRGNALHELNRFGEALEAYHRGLALNPNEPKLWLGRGNALWSLDRFGEALEAYDRGLALDPSKPFLWLGRGNALWDLTRFREALEAYDQGLEHDPNEPGLWLGRGGVLHDQNRFGEALEAFDRGLKLAPKEPNLWLGRGNALHRLNRFGEALEAYDRGLKHAPKEPILWQGRGNALSGLNRFSEALEAYDRGLELAPKQPLLWQGRGNALNDLGRFGEALEAYDRGLKLDPSKPFLWLGRGNALNGQNRFGEALEAYHRGLALDPNEPKLWLGRGNALWSLDRFGEALEAYNRGLALDPNEPSLWASKGGLLAKHQTLQKPHTFVTAQRCVFRALALLQEQPAMASKPVKIVISLLADDLDAPLLLHRLVSRYPLVGTMLSRAPLLREVERRTEPVRRILEWSDSPECALDTAERLLLRGRFELRFGDAPAAYLTLDKLDDLDTSLATTLTGQLYLAWAMQECLNDTSAQITSGADSARAALTDTTLPTRTCFDAGHLLLLADDLAGAARAFERAASRLLPARAMAWLCRKRLDDESAAQAHLNGLLEEEQGRFDRGVRGLLIPSDPPLPAPDTRDGRYLLEGVLETFECSEALDALRFDAALEKHPIYQSLVERLGGGIDEWMAEYERRLEGWGVLYADRDEMKRWREQRTEAWVRSERARLRSTLEWLNVEAESLRGAGLVNVIADRLYDAANPRGDNDAADAADAIALLFVQHRLPADSAAMLILYAVCRLRDAHDHTNEHAVLLATHALASFVGAVSHYLGIGTALDAIAAVVSVGLVGDVVAPHLTVWLKHRKLKEPFPRFERFRKELFEMWDEHGQPRAVRPPWAEGQEPGAVEEGADIPNDTG